MNTKKEKPLWFEFIKEHIDDNFEQLLAYYEKAVQNCTKMYFAQQP